MLMQTQKIMQMVNELHTDSSLEELKTICGERLTKILTNYLKNIPSLELKLAMEYTMLNSGKCIRPLFVFATGIIFNAPLENLDLPACAIEMTHTYSLIHDDLPCMDNADLRRGKPSCHKQYGEALAVLTGDALNSLAMQVIASHPAPLKSENRVQMIKILSKAAGPYGMVAGQALDVAMPDNESMSHDLLLNMYRLKTGALISASIEMGRLASKDDDERNQQALQDFGKCIGLAFQIQDDILDIESESILLGKQQGIDVKNHKTTYPKLHGMTQAKEKVESLYEEALTAINYLGHKAQLLRELTAYLLKRRS